MNLQQLKLWIKSVWHWLVEAKLAFMCLLVITAAIMLGFVTWSSETSIRFAGYVLQFIGMLFAIRGLLSIRAHFGQPLLRELFINWLKRFPKWKRNVVIGAGTAHAGLAGMKARVEVWSPDDPSLPIEERIEKIINNLDKIRIEQGAHAKLIDDLKDSHEEHKKLIAEKTKKIEENIHDELESLHTSDLITSLVGLVWLTAGITMSTMSQELYKWLH
ncbi:MAG: hypothetical protein KZQ85_04220 [Candidatus Thiodiazotropha sp. (ex Myrtea sp. 'scaly one' KF741663)]|nr:hypothetical protein [Candidatus Thiodiazotropha sp. (ex Myrtea sp. 'scaly one' KF741663)]